MAQAYALAIGFAVALPHGYARLGKAVMGGLPYSRIIQPRQLRLEHQVSPSELHNAGR